MRSARKSCVNTEKRKAYKKFKPCILSHLHTSDQSLCEVGAIAGLSVSESYTICENMTREWEEDRKTHTALNNNNLKPVNIFTTLCTPQYRFIAVSCPDRCHCMLGSKQIAWSHYRHCYLHTRQNKWSQFHFNVQNILRFVWAVKISSLCTAVVFTACNIQHSHDNRVTGER